MKCDDYHRTVIGYHGTGLTSALRLVNRVEAFRKSEKDYDWLGAGVYFWEYAPRQALAWAQIRQRQYQEKQVKTPEDERRATEPLAVVACMIRLGFCLDLTEPENIKYLREVYRSYEQTRILSGEQLPSNDRQYRRLDRAVFEYAYEIIEATGPNSKVETARGVYVPTDRTKRVWRGSWISRDTHIQICVRDPARNILGSWLHHPTSLRVNDACQALQADPAVVAPHPAVVEPEDPNGEETSQGDAEAPAN